MYTLYILTVFADLASLISFLGAHQISSQYLENISELGFFIYSLTKSTSFSICWKFQRTWMWNVVFYNILNFQMCSSKNKVVVVFLMRPTFFWAKVLLIPEFATCLRVRVNAVVLWAHTHTHTHTHSNMYIVHTKHNHSNMYIVHHTIHTLNNMYIVLTLQTCSIMYIVLTIHTNSSMYIVHTKYTHSHRHSPVHQISTLHWN